MGQALHSLQSQFGSDLIVAMAPQTIDMQGTSVEATDLATIDSLVGAGLGVAVLPSGAVRGNESGAVPVPLAGVQARREISMAWRLRTQLPPAAERFRTFVRSRPVAST